MNAGALKKLSLLLLIYIVLISTPILLAGYYSDDVLSGLTHGMVLATHQTIWEFSKSMFLMWLEIGRFSPCAIFLGCWFYYYFDTIVWYQIAHVILIWLSLFSVAWLIKLISKRIEPALFILFIIPMFWSVRNYHDPLTSFAVLLPCVTLFSILTFCFFIKGIESQKYVWHFVGAVFYALALCTYEIAIAVFAALILFAMIGPYPRKIILKQTIGYAVVTLLYAAVIITLHYLAPHGIYAGIQVGKISGFVHAFPNQFISGLPLSYWLFAPKRYFPVPLIDANFNLWIQLIPASGLFFFVLFPIYFLLPRISITKNAMSFLFCVGIAFVLTPVLLMSVSERYQTEIHFGVGYLPVYMEYIGFALLLLVLLNKINLTQITRIILTGLFSAVIAFSFFLNHYTIRIANEWEQNPRELIEQAIKNKFFAEIPATAILITKKDRWNILAFYSQNKVLLKSVVALNDANLIDVKRNPVYFLDYYVFPNSHYGYVKLARVQSIQSGLQLNDPKIFIFSGKRHYLFLSGSEVTKEDILKKLIIV